jgi:cell division protein FtsW (lipid II flippase)
MQGLTPALLLETMDEVDQAIARSCSVGGASRDEQVQAAALNIPEVHSDFIGSWLLVVLGRDGVLFLMCLQIMLVLLGLLAALSLARWVQTARISHVAASVIAYTIVGLTIVLALQWALSWGNTFGVTPVVGQPATFLSAGRSHLLTFGLGMVIAVMVGLRLTRARGRLQLDPLPPVPRRFARSLIVRWRERI